MQSALKQGSGKLVRLGPLRSRATAAMRPGGLAMVALDAISSAHRIRHVEPTESGFLELVEDMRSHGMLEPLLLRKCASGYVLVAGGRRMQAAQAIGMSHVPAQILDIGHDLATELAISENIHRENLNNLEEALLLSRLKSRLGSVTEVAKAVSKSKAWVSARLELNTLLAPAKALLDDHVTDDVDVLNMVNRATRLEPALGEQLAQRVRAAEHKREAARAGLEEIKLRLAGGTSQTESIDARKQVSRLSADLVRISAAGTAYSLRAREVRNLLANYPSDCRRDLEALLRRAFSLGKSISANAHESMNSASAELVSLLHRRHEPVQRLLVRAYSTGLRESAFDFQRIVAS